MVRSRQGTIRIAIADDHTIFRDGLRRVLAAEPDFEVVGEACNGLEVHDLLRNSKPDILLLDLKMPVLDGLGVLRQLSGHKLKTRIIVLTASEDSQDHAASLQLGAAAVALKRDTTDSLIATIRSVHNGEAKAVAPPQAPAETPQLQPDPDLPLTPREREIAELAVQGLTNRQMAAKLSVSEQTVKNHLHNIFEKLGFSDRLELALYVVHKRRRTHTT